MTFKFKLYANFLYCMNCLDYVLLLHGVPAVVCEHYWRCDNNYKVWWSGYSTPATSGGEGGGWQGAPGEEKQNYGSERVLWNFGYKKEICHTV